MIAGAVDQGTYFEPRPAQPVALLETTAVWRFGLALLVGHLLCLAYLVTRGGIYVLLDRSDPICWPFFEDCGANLKEFGQDGGHVTSEAPGLWGPTT